MRRRVGARAGDLDNPDVTGVLTEAFDLSAIVGPIDRAAGDLFATGASIGALLNANASPSLGGDAAAPGETAVATLTLDIAGTPGTYHLTFTDAYAITAAGQSVPITAGSALSITVGSESRPVGAEALAANAPAPRAARVGVGGVPARQGGSEIRGFET